jgi:putative cardiolipin synthase
VIRSAREEVVVASPYFVPGQEGMAAIRALRARGVKLRLLTNSRAATDEPFVHVGYARYREAMVRLGVDVREIGPGLVREHSRFGSFGRSLGRLHAKVAVIDRLIVHRLDELRPPIRTPQHGGRRSHGKSRARQAGA